MKKFIWAWVLAGVPALAAAEGELKDAGGARIIQYVVEAPEGDVYKRQDWFPA